MPSPRDEPPRLARQRQEPVVVSLDEPLTARCVQRLRTLVRGVSPDRTVILDLATISGFDSDGAAELQDLQDEMGAGRLVVVGFRRAAARLFGLVATFGDAAPAGSEATDSRIRPTPGMVLVELKPDRSAVSLQSALHAAVAKDIAVVIVELGRITAPSIEVLAAITSAARAAATYGEELVLVNVSAEAAALLRRLDLPETAYIAMS